MTRRTRTEYDRDENDRIVWSTRRDIDIDEWEGTWMAQTPHDMTGREIRPGDWVVKTFQSGRSSNMEIRQVREVRVVTRKLAKWETERNLNTTPRVFLGDSKVPVEYPGRCLVVPWNPVSGKVTGLSYPVSEH